VLFPAALLVVKIKVALEFVPPPLKSQQWITSWEFVTQTIKKNKTNTPNNLVDNSFLMTRVYLFQKLYSKSLLNITKKGITSL